MIKWIAIILCLLSLSCVKISYFPETGEVLYLRVGSQKLDDLRIVQTEEGVKVYLGGQEATAEQLTEILTIVRKLAL